MRLKKRIVGKEVKLLNKALVVENKAIESYLKGSRLFKAFGHWEEGLDQVIAWIAVESLFHKYIVEALLKAQIEADKLLESAYSGEESTPKSFKSAEIAAEFAERHLKIEEDMIDLYMKVAEEAEHPLVRSVALALAENEKEHHSQLGKIISWVKRKKML